MANITALLNTLANQLWNLAPGSGVPLPQQGMCLVAHRGAHEGGAAIENTLAAFDLCLQQDVWGIELDVRLTRDLEPVIHHDPHCGRLFGRPDLMIADTDFETLRRNVPDIPHLQEVVAQFGSRLHLMLEVKESPHERGHLAAVVEQALNGLEPRQQYHLMSLVPEYLEAFSQTPREAMIDIAWFNVGAIVKRNLALGHGAVAGSFALMGPRSVARLRAAGRRVGSGFLENAGALRRETVRGADWIFTDRIMTLQTAVNQARANI